MTHLLYPAWKLLSTTPLRAFYRIFALPKSVSFARPLSPSLHRFALLISR